jgi:hypothetical protein
MPQRQAPDALLLIATGCAHCPVVLEGLAQLIKQGRIGRLEVVNIVEHPEVAQAVGTRSVPWTRIGPFELEGLLSPAELGKWTDQAQRDEGIADYFSHLLETQRPHQVSTFLQRRADSLPVLISLLESEQTPMAVRIGIGVVLEELQGSELLNRALPHLIKLTHSPQANLRADAAHYLGLTHNNSVAPILRELLQDEHADVREIAADALEMLQTGST